mgnify:CR=1 FL=1
MKTLHLKLQTVMTGGSIAKPSRGSHVIVKCEGKELPDATFEEAARLAAHFSKGCNQDKVEIDYIQRKQVKKCCRCYARICYLPYKLFYGNHS